MYLKRYEVPVGKTLIIGHDANNGCDVIGFVEPSDRKMVQISDSLYHEYAKTTCKKCNSHFKHYTYKDKYKETYKNLFLAHPDMCVDILNEIGLPRVMSEFLSWDIRKNVWYTYAKKQLITPQYLVNGLLKWNGYEEFVNSLVSFGVFDKILDKATTYIYNQYQKCKGFPIEGLCKKNLDIFNAKKVPCNHNTLLFLQSLEDSRNYYIYDEYHESPLSLPNIHCDAMVCWGSNCTPGNLPEAYSTWWSSPFNEDLLLASSSSSAVKMIEGYGFYATDFIPYDEDYGDYDYDADPRSFTTDEVISIIRRGGNNPEKGSMEFQRLQFDVEGVQEILVVEDGRQIPDFAEIISEDFLRFLDQSDNLFIFLINEVEEDVWEAYLPTDENEGEYIQINLQDLCDLDLEDTEENEDDDNN